MQNPCAASQQGGERPCPGPHASGLHTGRALGSSKGGESSKEQLPPSLPVCLSCRAGVPQVLLLLLPPIYRDGRRRQVADVLSRPRSLPSNVPVTLPFRWSRPLPKGWMPCSAGAWAGVHPKPTLQGPPSPRAWAQSNVWHCQQWHGSHPTEPAPHAGHGAAEQCVLVTGQSQLVSPCL